jgi:hypothetical protein
MDHIRKPIKDASNSRRFEQQKNDTEPKTRGLKKKNYCAELD